MKRKRNLQVSLKLFKILYSLCSLNDILLIIFSNYIKYIRRDITVTHLYYRLIFYEYAKCTLSNPIQHRIYDTIVLNLIFRKVSRMRKRKTANYDPLGEDSMPPSVID